MSKTLEIKGRIDSNNIEEIENNLLKEVQDYDETVPLENDNGFVEGYLDPSTIHHFYHKLFKLGEQMNTETGKVLAKKRTDFMKAYTNEFLNEWHANYE